MRRIAIIACGEVPQPLQPRHNYPSMFTALLAPHAPDFSFDTTPLFQGATLPAPEEYDGYLFTGSRHGVYDQLPWIAPAEAFIRSALAAERPCVGICFGHQLMAQALGGRVEKAKAGWGIGMLPYTFRRDGAERTVTMPAIHQDQVVEKPRGAIVVAENARCPHAGLRYDGPALSFQFHPEFDHAFLGELIGVMEGRALPPDIAAAGRATLPGPAPDPAPVRWMADTLRGRP
jgi:GMP synthase-like glutamine amidotransferase